MHLNFPNLTQDFLMDDFTQNHMRKGNVRNVVGQNWHKTMSPL